MSELHHHLEKKFENIHFIYAPNSARGIEFSHEQLSLPNHSTILSSKSSYIEAWKNLNCLNPKAILISGNYPRINLVAAFWAKYKKRELYYLSDSNILDLKNIKRSFLNKLFLRKLLLSATKLLVIGARNQEFYISVCKSNFIETKLHRFVLPHLCDSFELPIQRKRNSFTFLILGRLIDIKGIDCAIRAFSMLAKQDRSKCQMVIAGDGPSSGSLKSLSYDLGVDGQIKFLGSIPSNEAPYIFAQADVVIVPSYQEPWGLVVNEALSSAKPVIAPHWIGSAIDLIQEKETGLVLEDNSPESIMNAMKYCIDHPDLVVRMGLSGRRLIRDGGWHIYGTIDSFSQLISHLNDCETL
jgi:glycosyltransferase involved in cell wall biosynthesis